MFINELYHQPIMPEFPIYFNYPVLPYGCNKYYIPGDWNMFKKRIPLYDDIEMHTLDQQ
jgi:hypothetical protein